MTGEQLATRLSRVHARIAGIRICQLNGVTLDQVASQDRHASVARARHQLIAYLRVTTALSLPEIGAIMDRDHTTVLSSVRKGLKRARAGRAA